MTSNNKIKPQTIVGEAKVEFIRKLTKSERNSLAIQILLYGWMCGIFVSLIIEMSAPWILSIPFMLYLVWFAPPVMLIIALLRRDHFLTTNFSEKKHRSYLEFHYRWRILTPISTFLLVFFYSASGFEFHDPKYFALSIAVFLFMFPLFLILDKPLTEDGEVTILFEMIPSPIVNFHEALIYWKRLAKKIEKKFKAGNVQVTPEDLIYNFSWTLLEGNRDISNDLASIREWMLGRARTCLKELRHIYPKIELLPCEKNVFLDWLLKNPEIALNYLFRAIIIAIAVALTIIGLHPNIIGL